MLPLQHPSSAQLAPTDAPEAARSRSERRAADTDVTRQPDHHHRGSPSRRRSLLLILFDRRQPRPSQSLCVPVVVLIRQGLVSSLPRSPSTIPQSSSTTSSPAPVSSTDSPCLQGPHGFSHKATLSLSAAPRCGCRQAPQRMPPCRHHLLHSAPDRAHLGRHHIRTCW